VDFYKIYIRRIFENIFFYLLPIYSLLQHGAISKWVRNWTWREKSSSDETPSYPIGGWYRIHKIDLQ